MILQTYLHSPCLPLFPVVVTRKSLTLAPDSNTNAWPPKTQLLDIKAGRMFCQTIALQIGSKGAEGPKRFIHASGLNDIYNELLYLQVKQLKTVRKTNRCAEYSLLLLCSFHGKLPWCFFKGVPKNTTCVGVFDVRPTFYYAAI